MVSATFSYTHTHNLTSSQFVDQDGSTATQQTGCQFGVLRPITTLHLDTKEKKGAETAPPSDRERLLHPRGPRSKIIKIKPEGHNTFDVNALM